MSQPFVRVDALNYTSVPTLTPRRGYALAVSLLKALPPEAPSGARHEARQMRANAVTLGAADDAAREAAAATGEKRSIRAVDNEADSLLGTTKRRLADHALLSAHDPATAEAAAGLKAVLFPEGDDFYGGDATSQWTATEGWFKKLAEEGREKLLRALVGGGFIERLRAVHAEYGETLGTTKALGPAATKVDVATPLAVLAQSVRDLALQLVAFANDRSATPAQRESARAALRPIDDLRASAARRGGRRATEADAEAETEPVAKEELPEVPDEPAKVEGNKK